MNSFALLQDDVEDASDASVNSEPSKPVEQEVSAPPVKEVTAEKSEPADAGNGVTTDDAPKEVKQEKEKEKEKEKDLTLEEYMQQKKAMSSGLASLNSRVLRQANDGKADPFENRSVLRKDEKADDNSIMGNVPVKEVQENKALRDSTQAAVARNAEIQKFFQKDPTDRRPREMRRGFGERRGRGRGERGRGRGSGRGRGGYRGDRGDRERYDRDNRDNGMNGTRGNPVPNVDDTSAFPSL